MSKDAEFKRQACIVLWLNCSAAISESLLVIGQPLLNPTLWQGQLLKSLVSLLSFNQRTTITQLKVNILTWNFHIIFLMINQHNPWHYGWPCPPSLQSGTLNILQIALFLTLPFLRHYILQVPHFLTLIPDTLVIKISTQTLQGILEVK